MAYEIAIVGAGSDPSDPDSEGYAMGYKHAAGYRRLRECRLAACVDIVPENGERFAERFELPAERVYEDHETMLAEVEPDIVSVCVPPPAHAPIVLDCAEAGSVEAIHCEKPMAETWEECTEMVETCIARDVKLTINHQRRFGRPFRKAKGLVDEGRIGPLERIELGGKNLYDYGTHLFDLCGYYTDGATAEWVLAAIDYREENVQFGTHNENQALAQWRYENGVYGLASTGESGCVACQVRLIGREGLIEIGAEEGPPLRAKLAGDADWRPIDAGKDGIHDHRDGYVDAAIRRAERKLPLLSDGTFSTPTYTDRAIADVVRAVAEDRESELAAMNALDATELIFASWESARRRGRVDLPLDIEDNPLESMVESGQLRIDTE